MKKASIALALLATSGVTAQELVLGADDKTLRQRVAFAGSPGSSTDADLASRVETLELQLNAMQSELDNVGSLDTEPPVIEIHVPANISGARFPLTISTTDNQGLLSLTFFWDQYSSPDTLYFKGEKSVQKEWTYGRPFGFDALITALAVDFSGNTAMATQEIVSDVAINPGWYELETPLIKDFGMQGCGYGPALVNLTKLPIGGYFKDIGEKCDYNDVYEDPFAVACLSASLQDEFPVWVDVNGAINSVTDTQYFIESTGTLGEGSMTSSFDIEFFDTSPPTMNADITVVCETPTYGTEQWGPYSVYGTLVE